MADPSAADKSAPLLEEEKGNITEQFVSFERITGNASALLGHSTQVVFSTLSTYWRIAAKTFAKACGVAIGWSWSTALHTTFSENFVPEALSTLAGVLYAVAVSLLTAFLIRWISQHQSNQDDYEFGKFGRNSRELLLVVQPMVLAWAWKDALREALWEHLPRENATEMFAYRFGFALVATVAIALAVSYMTGLVRASMEGEKSVAEQSYPVVLLSMMSAAFGLFLAWCWNETAASASMVISSGAATQSLTLVLYAAVLTGVATVGTRVLGDHSQELRRCVDETHGSSASQIPVLDGVLPLWVKFVDLISASLGYMVGWAWSDAFTCVFMEWVTLTDVRLLYLCYALAVSATAILYTSHVAKLIDDQDTPAGVKQYATLILNALGFMVGWAWKSYIQYFVQMLPRGGGQVFAQYFQALTATLAACLVYHKLRVWEAQSQATDVDKQIKQMSEAAGSAMD